MNHHRDRFLYPENDMEFQQISNGIYWLYMDKSHSFGTENTNIWFLEDTDGWLMVDTGMYTEKTVRLWESLLARPHHGKRIRQILITHFHPDHIGMSGWFTEHTSADFLMTREEYMLSSYLYSDVNGNYNRLTREYYAKNGMDDEYLAKFGKENTYRKMVYGLPKEFIDITRTRTLKVGLREWDVILCAGHSFAHVCLFNPDSKLLIIGDQVMHDRMTSLMLPVFERNYNPLEQYYGSLDLLSRFPKDTLALPSHGLPFVGLHEQLKRIKRYHEDRHRMIMKAFVRPFNAWDVYQLIYNKPLQGLRLKFAFERCVADLIYLHSQGNLMKSGDLYAARSFEPEERNHAYEPFS